MGIACLDAYHPVVHLETRQHPRIQNRQPMVLYCMEFHVDVALLRLRPTRRRLALQLFRLANSQQFLHACQLLRGHYCRRWNRFGLGYSLHIRPGRLYSCRQTSHLVRRARACLLHFLHIWHVVNRCTKFGARRLRVLAAIPTKEPQKVRWNRIKP